MSEQETTTHRQAPANVGPVLVAVDFTADSEAALIWACRYAACFGVPIRVLHVVHDPAEAPGAYTPKEHDSLRPMEEIAGDMMSEFLTQSLQKAGPCGSAADVEPIIVKGLPPTRIVEMAEKIGAEVIVMGSRGRTGLPHLLLGSKAERVAQLAPIPVTIVKAKRNDD